MPRTRQAFVTASHLAVWSGLYVAGAFVCFAQTAGLDAEIHAGAYIRAIAFSCAVSVAVYLLDRAKLTDAWLDPADAAAHPERFRFISAHAPHLRIAVAALLACASWIGFGLAPWAALLPVAAAAGIVLYAARPRGRRPRPKDVLVAKSLYIALGITGFAALTTIAAHPSGGSINGASSLLFAERLPFSIAIAHLFTRIFADAVLCDMDDERADRQFGTHTIAGALGRAAAWRLASSARILLAFALAAVALLPLGAPPFTLLCWAAATVVSTVVLRRCSPRKLRDWVDVRLALEAAAVSLALACRSSL